MSLAYTLAFLSFVNKETLYSIPFKVRLVNVENPVLSLLKLNVEFTDFFTEVDYKICNEAFLVRKAWSFWWLK